jgi:hypothetical protein
VESGIAAARQIAGDKGVAIASIAAQALPYGVLETGPALTQCEQH